MSKHSKCFISKHCIDGSCPRELAQRYAHGDESYWSYEGYQKLKCKDCGYHTLKCKDCIEEYECLDK